MIRVVPVICRERVPYLSFNRRLNMKQGDQRSRKSTGSAETAGAASDEFNAADTEGQGSEAVEGVLSCTPKTLPTRLLVDAAETATRINPVNSPVFGRLSEVAGDFQVSDPLRIALVTSKYWGPTPRQLTVSFMEPTPADLRARIISHMNAWNETACISFVPTDGTGDVRISRGSGGYYSYLGTDILHIPKNRQTMNLQGFTMNTSEDEYKRVVRHETGHTLGFPHEHMRKEFVAKIVPAKAYRWFLATYGWDKKTVDAQVLTPLDDASLMSTPPDQTSIMCYQLPGLITTDGKPITGGTDINETDFAFAGTIYPKGQQVSAGFAPANEPADWPESEDVTVSV
jgi:hypothetical protein